MRTQIHSLTVGGAYGIAAIKCFLYFCCTQSSNALINTLHLCLVGRCVLKLKAIANLKAKVKGRMHWKRIGECHVCLLVYVSSLWLLKECNRGCVKWPWLDKITVIRWLLNIATGLNGIQTNEEGKKNIAYGAIKANSVIIYPRDDPNLYTWFSSAVHKIFYFEEYW